MDGTYLFLGRPEDPCHTDVRKTLEAHGFATLVIADPFAHRCRFSWALDTEHSGSSLFLEGREPLRDDQIAGVVVLSPEWIDSMGWQPDDLTYVQAETQAALLAWLWSLQCPVVNRYPPAIWYRPQAPLLAWHGLLLQAGLPTLDTVVTNVEQRGDGFRHRLVADGPGAVYGPLTTDTRYLVASDEDWRGVTALQRVTPVSLSVPHGEPLWVCVVGEHVVWDGEPPGAAAALERGLRTFARATGLAVIEVALAPTSKGLCVVAVETRPRLERLREATRRDVVQRIVEFLTTGVRVKEDVT
jgi:hypothetical protein